MEAQHLFFHLLINRESLKEFSNLLFLFLFLFFFDILITTQREGEGEAAAIDTTRRHLNKKKNDRWKSDSK